MPTHATFSAFSRADLLQAHCKILRQGRLFNARVFTTQIDTRTWVIKDFACKPWFVHPIGRFLVARERRFLQHLATHPGFTQAVFSPDALSLAIAWIPGQTLQQIDSKRITKDYLLQLEQLIHQLHGLGIVHLDLRNAGNIICTPQDTPALIDFQSAMFTSSLPKKLKSLLEAIDMSGAYKMWSRFAPQAMGRERLEALERVSRLLRWWPFKGYCGLKKKSAD